MPLYSYRCPQCGKLEDKLLKLADSDTLQYCDCTGDGDGYQMIKQLTAARVVTDYPGYNCPITGAWIEGRAAHRENLAKHNCRVFEPGEMENTRRYMAKVDADMDKAVDATVDQFIAELPSDKRDKLAAEMDAGLDVQYTRQTVEA